MALALFDLDNTLIGGDSDYLWGEFLVDHAHVDASDYAQKNAQFYEDYKQGQLDIVAYLEFALHPLTLFSPSQLDAMHRQFMQEKIDPIWLPKAIELVDKHRQANDTLVIITATNKFITQPIAQRLGIDHLIASEGEIIHGKYTGKVQGTPCYREGKIDRLNQWLAGKDAPLEESYFYSDSFNDIPLLNEVGHPVAVDPDDNLLDHAKKHNMPIISLR